MMEKTNILTMLTKKSNNVNSNGEHVVAINPKLFSISFFKNCRNGVQVETSKFFGLKFFKMPTKLDFPYL